MGSELHLELLTAPRICVRRVDTNRLLWMEPPSFGCPRIDSRSSARAHLLAELAILGRCLQRQHDDVCVCSSAICASRQPRGRGCISRALPPDAPAAHAPCDAVAPLDATPMAPSLCRDGLSKRGLSRDHRPGASVDRDLTQGTQRRGALVSGPRSGERDGGLVATFRGRVGGRAHHAGTPGLGQPRGKPILATPVPPNAAPRVPSRTATSYAGFGPSGAGLAGRLRVAVSASAIPVPYSRRP